MHTPVSTLALVPDPPETWAPSPGVPTDRHPIIVYLAGRVSPRSRRAMAHALGNAARLLTNSRLILMQIPWHQLDYQHIAAIRAKLLTSPRLAGEHPYSPAPWILVLTGIRGVLQERRRLGLMSREHELRAGDVAALPNRRLPPGRMLSPGELERLFTVCAQDPRPAGRRDAALLAVMMLTGPRRREVIHLNLAAYEREACTVAVRVGKGNKDRLLFAMPGLDLPPVEEEHDQELVRHRLLRLDAGPGGGHPHQGLGRPGYRERRRGDRELGTE